MDAVQQNAPSEERFGRLREYLPETRQAHFGGLPASQIRLNTSVPLVPPKPKPLETTTSTVASRAVLGT